MTAVAARYDDVLVVDDALTGAVVDALDEETLIALLVVRFHFFVARGYGDVEALLLAVGYSEADLSFFTEAATDRAASCSVKAPKG